MSAATWATARPEHISAAFECPAGCLFVPEYPDEQVPVAAVKVEWRASRFSDGSAQVRVEAWANIEAPYRLRVWALNEDDRTPRDYSGELPEWMPPVPGWLLDVVAQMRSTAPKS